MIKNIIFDIGDVLVGYSPKKEVENLNSNINKIEIANNLIIKDNNWIKYLNGLIILEDLLKYYNLKYPNYEKEFSILLEKRNQKYIIYEIEKNTDIVKKLSTRYNIYLLSNITKETFEYVNEFAFIKQVKGGVYSFQEHISKPDKAIYKILLSKYDLLPEESIFIDDKLKNVEEAEKLGIKGILYKKEDNLSTLLEKEGIDKMNIQEIIAKKRDKQSLSKEEIEFFITEYVKENIADYQASALIMAIYINGMNEEEITNLTLAMANSGDILDLSELGNVVDKHSTGGVGDKVTLILAPIIASLGVPVAKMSGRGLGYTGGTIDKLEAILGYRTNLSEEEFIQNVKKIGISIIGQTLNLAPADKKIYALRDATSTTESIPLIASSIMSKKIAAGANKIVLDVTYGSGAFMKTKEKAQELADTMIKIGELAGRETVAVITPMEQPLGRNVGNTLEVIEAVEALKGNIEEDVKEVVLELGSNMLKLAGKGNDLEENKKKMLENIQNGKALEKLKELVKNQGGDVSYIEDTSKFKKAKYIMPVILQKDGIVKELKAEEIGKLSVFLGGGRIRKEDAIDSSVGIVLNKKIGDKIEKNNIVAYIHANDEKKGEEVVEKVKEIYEIR